MNRKINRVAVLGSGVMGSRIACHFANAGVQVLLLDIVPRELSEEDLAKGFKASDKSFKNKIVDVALQAAIKSSPSPLYQKEKIKYIKTGNFDDNLSDIKNCDWVIEVVIENLEIKKSLFDKVELHRTPGTLITTNTSGIPIHDLTAGRSEDFIQHFCGTHFFNPPRYLPLLEIIPTDKTKKEVTDFLLHYGDHFLGKTTIECNDTPAFIANRIGVFAMMDLFHQVEKSELSVEDIDKLTGPVLGRPKSATFRTCDVVGLDTLVHVANDLYKNAVNDLDRDTFLLPSFIKQMVDNKWLGDKTKQGFYKKIKTADGKSEIQSLNLSTLEYNTQKKTKFAVLETTKGIDDLAQRLPLLFNADDKAGKFYQAVLLNLFHYVSFRIPETADKINKIDEALKAGFGWEMGPFEMWDALGIKNVCDILKQQNIVYASWVDEMLNANFLSFYSKKEHNYQVYNPLLKQYEDNNSFKDIIILKHKTDDAIVFENTGVKIKDIGDNVICCEFQTKMNTVGGDVMQGVMKAIDLAEKNYQGLVIGNQGPNFSAGANLALVYMLACEQDWDEIDMACRMFQKMNMRIRYSSIPVVVATQGLSLGGACEMSLHADKVQAAAETYTGLVEAGVGIIPAGAGTKEFALRLSDSFIEGDIEINNLRERFMTIAMAKVSTSAAEAFDNGIFRKGIDEVTLNGRRLISEAKKSVIELAEAGYVMPQPRKDIKVLGVQGLGAIQAAASIMKAGNYISDHDKLISEKLAYIMCGGDLSSPTLVSEDYLLQLEREAFLSLCGTRKTLERIQAILTTGKPLRN